MGHDIACLQPPTTLMVASVRTLLHFVLVGYCASLLQAKRWQVRDAGPKLQGCSYCAVLQVPSWSLSSKGSVCRS